MGVLAERGEQAYTAIAGTALAGRAWTPLNPALPPERLGKIVKASGLSLILYGDGQEQLAGRLAALNPQAVLVQAISACASAPPISEPADQPLDGPAYLLFTSGSTGEPKGVAVSQSNLLSYLDNVIGRYGYGPTDRHTQTFELTFDLSVHDMMCAWTTGGALVPILASDLLKPAQAAAERGVTAWFSVPSLALFMQRSRALKPGVLPNLRVSLFCGEALPVTVADAWTEAAPGSVVENIYGPTEATIAFTGFRWAPDRDVGEPRRGVVPIGWPFAHQSVELIDADGVIVSGPGRGELLLGGSQVTGSYWNDPEQTRARYLQHGTMRWYRTGDLVERDETGCCHFLGRLDSQVKFRGFRIELGEIEHALREVAKTPEVAVVAWPVSEGQIVGLTAVVSGCDLDAAALKRGLAEKLPAYMTPGRILFWPGLPTNLSGKLDRKEIIRLLECGQQPTEASA